MRRPLKHNRNMGPQAASRRGSALVLALMVVAFVSSLGAGYLMLSRALASKHKVTQEVTKAFYLAEAGLAEAFHAVRMGRTGQLGSLEQPAVYGPGLVWVDATESADGHVELHSTAIVGTTRSSLAFVVEPVDLSLGFFSDEDLVIESVLLADGFDSEIGDYSVQISGQELIVDPTYTWLMIDETNNILFYEGNFFRFLAMDGYTFTWDEDFPYEEALALERASRGQLDFSGFIREEAGYDPWASAEYLAIVAALSAKPYVAVEGETGEVITSELGPTTGDSGLIGSNGDVLFEDPDAVIEIFGDVRTGPASATSGPARVTGDWTSRGEAVDLPPVEVPDVRLAPPILHDGLLPLLISPGTSGFKSLEVATDAELILRGPATVVIGNLTLQPGASLELDTRDGDVALYITGGLDLQAGSFVTTPADAPDQLTVQVGAIPSNAIAAPVQLNASASFHGTIYSPDSAVHVGGSFEVYGSIAARQLTIGAGARLHFDDTGFEDSPIPRVISWKVLEVPAAIKGHGDIMRMLGLGRQDLRAMTDAHDLASVTISVVFLDHGGIQRVFSGSEADLDWDTVAEVIRVERDPMRTRRESELDSPNSEPSGSASDSNEDVDQDNDGISSIPTGARAGVASAISDRDGLIAKAIEDRLLTGPAPFLPLSQEEWGAIEAIPNTTAPKQLDDLRTNDIFAGGTGGVADVESL
ncbi:MAG: hypothetical protein ACI8QZ_001580 [Chlamydiales bacterium]|jgi:hypothetical protein